MEVMLFNEWKDSSDYVYQKWSINKIKEIESWFTDTTELKLDSIDSNSENQNIYTIFVYFNEDKFQYTLELVVNGQIKGTITDIDLVLKQYIKETEELKKETTKTINEADLSYDLLLQLIDDLKSDETNNVSSTQVPSPTSTPEAPATPAPDATTQQ